MTSRSTCVRVHVTDSVPVEPACGDATSLQLEAGVPTGCQCHQVATGISALPAGTRSLPAACEGHRQSTHPVSFKSAARTAALAEQHGHAMDHAAHGRDAAAV